MMQFKCIALLLTVGALGTGTVAAFNAPQGANPCAARN